MLPNKLVCLLVMTKQYPIGIASLKCNITCSGKPTISIQVLVSSSITSHPLQIRAGNYQHWRKNRPVVIVSRTRWARWRHRRGGRRGGHNHRGWGGWCRSRCHTGHRMESRRDRKAFQSGARWVGWRTGWRGSKAPRRGFRSNSSSVIKNNDTGNQTHILIYRIFTKPGVAGAVL